MDIKIDSTKLVCVHLKVRKSLSAYSEYPRDYVVGVSILDSTVNKFSRIQRCKPICFDSWVLEKWVQKNTPIHFKYVVIRSRTSTVVESETIQVHRAFIGVEPVQIECTFNGERIIIREAEGTRVKAKKRLARNILAHRRRFGHGGANQCTSRFSHRKTAENDRKSKKGNWTRFFKRFALLSAPLALVAIAFYMYNFSEQMISNFFNELNSVYDYEIDHIDY
ncbi:uncharacterized protein LOC132715168 [Ruditapes philippinarum]|uniref:uncharacterized protein LOC132715168 n=1 Tax=Ruditapes philippinarum TaxID=129788 RepID=UPI00295B690E|nr:uncharacterized protein LOC132715168 [Ruditapes philippinarum]